VGVGAPCAHCPALMTEKDVFSPYHIQDHRHALFHGAPTHPRLPLHCPSPLHWHAHAAWDVTCPWDPPLRLSIPLS